MYYYFIIIIIIIITQSKRWYTREQVVLAASAERASEHNGEFVFVIKQSMLAVIKDDVVYRRKMVIADAEFAIGSLFDLKVTYSVLVFHRESVRAALQEYNTATGQM